MTTDRLEKSCATGYRVRFRCTVCGTPWVMTWSCACDDECPNCGTPTEARDYELDGTYTQEELDAYNGVAT